MIYATKEERQQMIEEAIKRVTIGPVVVKDHYLVAEIGPLAAKRFVAVPCFCLESYFGTLDDALEAAYALSTGCFADGTYRCDFGDLTEKLSIESKRK